MELYWERLEGADPHEAWRRLLGRAYLAKYGAPMPPIARTDRGKPFFAGDPVYFSVSHSTRHVFVAVSDVPVGVDAEEMDRRVPRLLTERALSASEQARIAGCADRARAFLRVWVQKEADGKRRGVGIEGFRNTDFDPDAPCVQEIDGCYVAVLED